MLTISKDQGPLDLSTAPSSASNVSSYFMNQQYQNNLSQNSDGNNNNISNQFWRKPNTANASSNISNVSQFTPTNTAVSSSTLPTYNQTRSQFDLNNYGNAVNNDYQNLNNEKEERLKIDLKIKESQIESLENEIQRLTESMNLIESNTSSLNQPTQVPKNINDIFSKLTTNYTSLETELNDTKKRLESLVTAITLNPTNSVSNNGRYDELEISHKIILKLELLQKENDNLLKHLSFGKSKEAEIEMNLLKMENEKLKELLKKYEN